MCMHARMRRLVWSGDVRRRRPWPARGKICACACAFLVYMYMHVTGPVHKVVKQIISIKVSTVYHILSTQVPS